MSAQDIKSALLSFLESDEPGVLCLSGKWGVGKTYLWNQCLKEAKDKIKLSRYSYVSLFGIGSLDELKIKTCLEVAPIQEPTKKVDPKWLYNYFFKLKKDANILAPVIDVFADTDKIISSIGFRAFSKALVCIDDIERKSAGITIPEILSFASFLKEERGCKVVILMNSDALEEEDKNILNRYQEKVVDSTMILNTSCEEAVGIAFEGRTDETSVYLKECVLKLGINNIRIVKKIQVSSEKILKLLPQPTFADSIRGQALQTLCLYSWAHYDSGEHVPSIEFLKRYNRYGFSQGGEGKEQAWHKTLTDYTYAAADEFDLEIYEFIVHGYVLETSFLHQANKLNARVGLAALEAEFHSAWDLYHDTFEDNQEELLNKLYTSFRRAVKTISPINLNGTVSVFCELNDQGRAQELIDFYIQERGDETELFDLNQNVFGDITNPLVIEAFRKKYDGVNRPLTLAETIDKIIKEGVGRRTNLRPMIDATEDDYYAYFSSLRNRCDIRECVNTCLRFRGHTGDARTISDKAIAALRRLSNESPLNRRRVLRFINLDAVDELENEG